ncbi:hypothetical protein GCM10023346_25430 [Arthrobacter gyeryongensis]|uniref:Glyoxalase-like domain-containing protein n=1 Tax=Arthrobacter gyeryongensis TaxID=1650592 RepID=A0ABP9SGR5_9MICC
MTAWAGWPAANSPEKLEAGPGHLWSAVAGIGIGIGEGAAAWNTCASVDDADDAAQRLLSVGATVLSAPADACDGGRSVPLADREGAEFTASQFTPPSG